MLPAPRPAPARSPASRRPFVLTFGALLAAASFAAAACGPPPATPPSGGSTTASPDTTSSPSATDTATSAPTAPGVTASPTAAPTDTAVSGGTLPACKLPAPVKSQDVCKTDADCGASDPCHAHACVGIAKANPPTKSTMCTYMMDCQSIDANPCVCFEGVCALVPGKQ